jgi:hypothetical protein
VNCHSETTPVPAFSRKKLWLSGRRSRLSARCSLAITLALSRKQPAGLVFSISDTAAVSDSSRLQRIVPLERLAAAEEVDDTSLVRLEPAQLGRRHRTDVQAVDVRPVEQRPLELP